MVDGATGTEYTVIVLFALVKQVVPDFTLTDPLVKGVGKVTVMALLPCPEFMTAFVGTVQV
jgi:hypothetical protein